MENLSSVLKLRRVESDSLPERYENVGVGDMS